MLEIGSYIPLLLDPLEANWAPKPFQALDVWHSHLSFKKIVKEEWRKLGEIGVAKKMKDLRGPLRKWSKEIFGNIDNKIKIFEEEIDKNKVMLETIRANEVLLARHFAMMN